MKRKHTAALFALLAAALYAINIPFSKLLLDVAAPILLMLGLQRTNAANASLLNHFEIAATSLVAFFAIRNVSSKVSEEVTYAYLQLGSVF